MTSVLIRHFFYLILGILLGVGLPIHSEENSPKWKSSYWVSPYILKNNNLNRSEILQESDSTYPAMSAQVNSSASGSVLLSFIRVSQEEEEFLIQKKTGEGEWTTLHPEYFSLIKVGDLTFGKSEDTGLANGTHTYRFLAKKPSGQIVASQEWSVGLEYTLDTLRPRANDQNQDGAIDERDLLDLIKKHLSETESSKTEDLWNLGSGWYTGQSVIRQGGEK